MTRIFISYRRDDAQCHAGRLSDLLGLDFGESAVFLDVHGIAWGEDFERTIGHHLSECNVFIAVIGPRWLRIRKGLRLRLFLPEDFVRLEVLAALHRNIELIPVLVGGAAMPSRKWLPKSIRALASRHAMILSETGFRADVASLSDVIKKRLDQSPEASPTAVEAERERITTIMERDVATTVKRRGVQDGAVTAGLAAAFVIFLTTWFVLQRNRVEPHFAQQIATPNPEKLSVAHPAPTEDDWKFINSDQMRPQRFSPSRGLSRATLTISDVWGSRGVREIRNIYRSGQIVFETVGSTGNARNPGRTNAVADQMVKDFDSGPNRPKPSFLFLLGDLVLYFGEREYYYDQFYSPFRNYPAPILAIPGNHDGLVAPGAAARSLDAFMANFCSEPPFHKTADAKELDRTAQTQPGVYFTFEAPFVRILGLYSNVHEGNGILSDESGTYRELTNAQLEFLTAGFNRIKSDHFQGAVILAVHHDMISSARHGGSPGMLADLDQVSISTGVWPHLVLSANAHNYRRYTRSVQSTKIQYLVVGTGGAPLAHFNPSTVPPEDSVLQKLDDRDLGYLRVSVNQNVLHAEFQVAGSESAGVQDAFTLDLATRNLTQ